ncbi:MAG TPA: hypothetical protein VOA87_18725, partial [Thermoanaerobaculia bacterium]|nr:hypothetical protein [Thermoanaerobaculia bacterium]
GPVSWRAGMPQVESLASFLAAARPLLPAGSAVVFASPPHPESPFRYRWAAYLYPEVELIPLSDPQAGSRGRYLLAYRTQIDHPRLELLRWLPGGRLYRIRAIRP